MASFVGPTVQTGYTLAAPASAPTTVYSGTGGLLGNGNYQYKVGYVTANGESLPSAASIAAGPGTTTGSCAVSGILVGNAFVTSRKLYRTTAGGSTFSLLATINDNTTTTFADTVIDGSLGAAAPAVSTADPSQTILTTSTFGNSITAAAPSNQLIIKPGANSFTVTAANPAASRTLTLPDPGNAANVMLTSIKGANPSVTQITSNTTAVTTTATTGIVTMFGTIAGAATGAFTLNNVNILATSNVVAWSNMVSATAFFPVDVVVSSIVAGSCTVTVTNTDGGNATKAAPKVYYLVI